MNAPDLTSVPINRRQCVFCREDIRPGATVCPHCGNALTPMQEFADGQAALAARVIALEEALAATQATIAARTATALAEPQARPGAAPAGPIRWPHMADNIFLGLTALLAAHWLVTTLPERGRVIYHFVALAVALPFGYRFEHYSRSGARGRVLAALSFGILGSVAIIALDVALAGGIPAFITARNVFASVAAIALSHFTGSALAHAQQKQVDRAAMAAAAAVSMAASEPRGFVASTQIKTTAETVKAVTDAATPVAAGAAALWAALGHNLF